MIVNRFVNDFIENGFSYLSIVDEGYLVINHFFFFHLFLFF